MIYATLDIEILDDPDYVRLEMHDSAWPWWFLRLVQLAKRTNLRGQILIGSRPARADDLALAHSRRMDEAPRWQEMLDYCVELGLLHVEDGAYTITDWRRWHRKPSDQVEQTRERKQRSRDGHADTARVTTRDMKSVTHVTPQSRAEQSKAETEQSRASATAEHAREARDAAVVVSESVSGIRPGLGMIGSMRSRELDEALEWARKPLESGEATPADITTAAEYARDAVRYQLDQGGEITSKWRYAMTVAGDVLGQAIARRKMAEEAHRDGLPAPRPFRFAPPAQKATPA